MTTLRVVLYSGGVAWRMLKRGIMFGTCFGELPSNSVQVFDVRDQRKNKMEAIIR